MGIFFFKMYQRNIFLWIILFVCKIFDYSRIYVTRYCFARYEILWYNLNCPLTSKNFVYFSWKQRTSFLFRSITLTKLNAGRWIEEILTEVKHTISLSISKSTVLAIPSQSTHPPTSCIFLQCSRLQVLIYPSCKW